MRKTPAVSEISQKEKISVNEINKEKEAKRNRKKQ